MGRKTYQSIGKALPNRRNIVITKNKKFICANCEIFHSLQDALAVLESYPEIMIIGGEKLYKEALPLADTLYLTLIHSEIAGDTYFPYWDKKQWQEIKRQDFPATKEAPFSYSFVTYNRGTK